MQIGLFWSHLAFERVAIDATNPWLASARRSYTILLLCGRVIVHHPTHFDPADSVFIAARSLMRRSSSSGLSLLSSLAASSSLGSLASSVSGASPKSHATLTSYSSANR